VEIINQHHQCIAVFIARIFLGFLFLFQGYDVIFNIKIKNVIATYQSSFQNKGIPGFLTVLGAWFTSYTELVCGFFLILGCFEYISLYLLGINLIIASIAFGINAAMWDMRYIFPRLILLLFLLIAPDSWNIWALDTLIFKP
jgi:uncharacterized membrane protein YphA (DoxX/SURF4 family)